MQDNKFDTFLSISESVEECFHVNSREHKEDEMLTDDNTLWSVLYFITFIKMWKLRVV